MLNRIVGGVATLAVVCVAGASLAADSKEAREAKAKIWEIGKKWDAEVGVQTRAIYDPIHPKYADKTAQEVKATSNLAFGPDEKQTVDVFLPAKKGTGRAMVAFFHGGGHTGGDKGTVGNATSMLARNNVIGVNANYRLSPAVKFPEQSKDVGAVVALMKSKAKEWGGDPNRIYLWGTSAGATIIASYLYDADLQPGNDPGVAGAILTSGVYVTSRQGPRRQVSINYYGADDSKWVELEPAGKLKSYRGKMVPTLITNAELNPDNIEIESVELYEQLCRKNGCPRYFQTVGHNHLSEISHLNTADLSLAPVVLDFIRSTPAAGLMKTAPAK